MELTFGTLAILEQITGVLRAVFGPDKFAALNTDFVRWMSNGPHGVCRWYAAFDGTRPVAVYGLLPLIASVDGKFVPTALCHNVGVIPEYRGKGVFTQVGKYALDDMEPHVAFGVPNATALRGHMRVGWSIAGTLEMLSSKASSGMPAKPDNVVEADMDTAAWLCAHEDLHDGYALKVHRSREFFEWRLRKPDTKCMLTRYGSGFALWKWWNGRKQVLAASDGEVVLALGPGTDVLAMRDTYRHRVLWDAGFEPVFERELILWHGPTEGNVRFDACDFDLL